MLIIAIIGLALLDSAAFGTLLIPVWLIMAPGKFKFGRIVIYLLVLTLAYFLIGLALVMGADALFERYQALFESAGFYLIVTVAGAALAITGAILSYRGRGKARGDAEDNGPGRMFKIRSQIMQSEDSGLKSASVLVSIALTAVALEVATMLPYLGAIGLMVANDLSVYESGVLLAVYCGVMVLPALLLALGKVISPVRIGGPLATMDAWLSRQAKSSSVGLVLVFGAILLAVGIYQLVKL
ncbi:GAP family protein [Kocuria sp. SL71]|uniref:GAP family protein n=1 Tax=Kocuria sp. SL71 TaxID=2995151 RepID=UPI002276F5F2|nr:GAP family protein [Kocuria sp. SL71]MCY1684000.1 GAP family protein [Kocuria sp. SL71]